MRVLVFGGWFGSGNIGDDAILIGVRGLFQGHKLVALSTDPAQTERVCRIDALRLRSPREAVLDPGYLRRLRGFDACLVTGGTPFYDYDHASRLLHLGAGAASGRLILFGVGCKEIASPQGRALIRLLASRAARVSARDPYSLRLLRGVGCDPVLTGDSGLLVEPDRAAAKGVDGEYAVVCPRFLSPRHRAQYHDPVEAGSIARIRAGVASAADALAAQGLKVVFAPFHSPRGGGDLAEIGEIRAMMKGGSEVVEPRTPEAAAGLIGGAEIVVGLRLHSLVFAAAQGVPAVSVGYDAKIRGFLEAVGAPWLVAPPEGLGGAALEALRRRAEVGGALRGACKAMKERIRWEAEEVNRLLADPRGYPSPAAG